ncbi:MAG: hypothetical protein K8T10_11495 [Candidatus Eremiobacteraeota bacterium]|nr:hypothetical protein [Candidatus Eremiobacteraeota bacterium]
MLSAGFYPDQDKYGSVVVVYFDNGRLYSPENITTSTGSPGATASSFYTFLLKWM